MSKSKSHPCRHPETAVIRLEEQVSLCKKCGCKLYPADPKLTTK